METMIQPVNSSTINLDWQAAESPLQSAQSFKEVLRKQSSPAEKNKDQGQEDVAAAFFLNLLPILPDLKSGGIEDFRENLVAAPNGPAKPESLLSAASPMPNLPEIQNPFPQSREGSQRNLPYLNQPELLKGSKDIPLESGEGGVQAKGISHRPNSHFNFLETKETMSSLNPRPQIFFEFAGEGGIPSSQNAAGQESLKRLIEEEFAEAGDFSKGKSDLKMNSASDNQPRQEPYAIHELPGNPKPTVISEEISLHQKPPLAKGEQLHLFERIGERVIWAIRNNEERIRLILEPPHLGNLYIEIHKEKEEIKATLWADNPLTKEILENNQSQLQKILEGDGFKLEKYEVFVQNEMGSFPGKEESPVFQGPGSRKQSLETQEAELPQSLEVLPGAIPAAGGSQYIDRFI